jgi:hypothetical protein
MTGSCQRRPPRWTDTDTDSGGRPRRRRTRQHHLAALLPDDGPTGGFYRDGRPLPW